MQFIPAFSCHNSIFFVKNYTSDSRFLYVIFRAIDIQFDLSLTQALFSSTHFHAYSQLIFCLLYFFFHVALHNKKLLLEFITHDM